MSKQVKADAISKFKKRPGGNIPADWEYCKLGKYIDEVSERNSALKDIPVLSVTNSRGFVVSEDFFDRQVYSKDLSNYKLVKKNQFAYNPARVNVGSISLLKKFPEGLLSPMYVVFKTKSGLHPEFLHYWISSVQFRNLVEAGTQGSVRNSLNFSVLANFLIAVPPISEQERIVAAARSIDLVIEKTELAIEQAQRFKAAISDKLFTKGVNGVPERIKRTKVGPIPFSWELCTCRDICNAITVGIVVQPKKLYVNGGVPCLRSLNIQEDAIACDRLVYISHESNEAHSKSKLYRGDVVAVRTGKPGTSCVVPPEFDGTNCIDLIVFRPRSVINSDFLSRFINSPAGRRQVVRNQGGLAQQHFNIGEAKKLSIPVPPMREQKQIVNILKSIEANIAGYVQYLDGLGKSKAGLLKMLFVGEHRLG